MAVADASSLIGNGASSANDLEQDERQLHIPQQQGQSLPAASVVQQEREYETLKLTSGGEQEGEGASAVPLSVKGPKENGFHHRDHGHQHDRDQHEDRMRALEEYFSKLNPHAKEFVPPACASHTVSDISSTDHDTSDPPPTYENTPNTNRKKKTEKSLNKRRTNNRLLRVQWDDSTRRTVYVSDIDQQVTEEQLAALFLTCGQVVDCRVCGDPNSVLRFAFVEFTDEEGAHRALSLAGTMLGFYPVRVLPSKTAIVPVNPTFLPQSEDEREMCARTIYCTNIDKKISQAEVRLFFESLCGKVARLRLLGEYRHSTRIAFVEFIMAESAIAALNCSGAILGFLPIRVSPSKTPVRPCMSRSYLI